MWVEGTDGTALLSETASGSCLDGASTGPVNVSLPAISMPVPTLVRGYAVNGAGVSLGSGEVGELAAAAGAPVRRFYVFEDVDCSTDCGTPGWYELHSLVVPEGGGPLAYAILYLVADDGSGRTAFWSYGLELTTLVDPVAGLGYEAVWLAP